MSATTWDASCPGGSRRSMLRSAGKTVVDRNHFIVDDAEPILVTGAAGFIGRRVVESLLQRGFTHIRCLARSGGSTGAAALSELAARFPRASVELLPGNLLNRQDCARATRGVSLVYHLAAGNEKSFAGCFMNSVLTTRNLLEAVTTQSSLRRLV